MRSETIILVVTAGRQKPRYRICMSRPKLSPSEFAYRLRIQIPDGWLNIPEVNLPVIESPHSGCEAAPL